MTPRPFTPVRALVISFVFILVASALIVPAPQSATATPSPPWFGSSVRVTQLPAYTGYQPSLAVGTDGVLYLAYAGWGGSATQADIFFTKSLDAGRSWTAPIRVNQDSGSASQGDPSLALDASNNVYVVWTDPRGGTNDVYFSKSTDGGSSFSANVRVNEVTPSYQQDADLVVDHEGLIHVVWQDGRNVFTTWGDIYYANSTDGGVSFNANLRLNDDLTSAEQGSPAIAVGPDRSVYVVWSDSRTGARGSDIYFSKSSDLGETWVPSFPINDDVGNAAQTVPTIGVNETGAIFVAWQDYRVTNTGPDIFATRSTNDGASFAANVLVNDDGLAVLQAQPSLAVAEGSVRIAWTDARTTGSTSYDIYTSSSEDGLAWSANLRVNDDTLAVLQWTPTLAMDRVGNAFVAWFDQRDTGQDVYASTLDVIAPTANAGSALQVGQGVVATFDARASTDSLGIAAYDWDFGDGSSASGSVVTHAYSIPGTYTATLRVVDYSGNVGTATRTVVVRDTEAPVARGGGDRTVDEGQPVFFDASSSTDNVGIASYVWDFGDGESSTDAATTHVYGRPGTYDASLTVTDAAGNSDTVTMTVTVRAVSPKASDLLGMIQLLQLIIVLLAIAIGALAYLVLGRRRGGPRLQSMQAPEPPTERTPGSPPDPDPLDLPLPDEPKAP